MSPTLIRKHAAFAARVATRDPYRSGSSGIPVPQSPFRPESAKSAAKCLRCRRCRRSEVLPPCRPAIIDDPRNFHHGRPPGMSRFPPGLRAKMDPPVVDAALESLLHRFQDLVPAQVTRRLNGMGTHSRETQNFPPPSAHTVRPTREPELPKNSRIEYTIPSACRKMPKSQSFTPPSARRLRRYRAKLLYRHSHLAPALASSTVDHR